MLLAANIGNSIVGFAIFDGEDLLASWRLRTRPMHTADDWWLAVRHLAHDAGPDVAAVDAAAIASVVPVVGQAMTDMCQRYLHLQPLRVNAHLPLELGLDVKDPDSVGADRICNVVGARELYGTPGVVVDMGTATNFDVIDEQGHFIGGSIAPGLETSARQLFSGAALLSAVDLTVPDTVIGRDTATNLQAGIIFGAVDQIDGMLTRIQAETGWEDMNVVLTGGLGGLIVHHLRSRVTYDPDLTVKGLRLIHTQCS